MSGRKPIVAIDGPVGAGKSTTARKVAELLNFIYVDTGAMYRACTLDVFNRGADPADEAEVAKIIGSTKIELILKDGRQWTLLNGVDVTDRIRDGDVTNAVSTVSAMKCVRNKMTLMQRDLGRNGGVVMEGRDIGTVVFPDAEYKFYMDASIEVRAGRRHRELAEKGVHVDFDVLVEEIKERDRLNSERALAPLMRAEDARHIDTSDMTFEEQVSAIVSIVYGEKR